jgi:hypothetical protein
MKIRPSWKKSLECKSSTLEFTLLTSLHKVPVFFYRNFNVKKKDANVKNTSKVLIITSSTYQEIIRNSFVIFVSKMRFYYWMNIRLLRPRNSIIIFSSELAMKRTIWCRFILSVNSVMSTFLMMISLRIIWIRLMKNASCVLKTSTNGFTIKITLS